MKNNKPKIRKPINLNDLQRYAQEIEKHYSSIKGIKFDLEKVIFKLFEETIELTKVLTNILAERAKLQNQDYTFKRAYKKSLNKFSKNLSFELVDCLTCILVIANHLGVKLEDVIIKKRKEDNKRS